MSGDTMSGGTMIGGTMSGDIPTRTTMWARALRTEAGAALATPVARALLAASVVMAVLSGSANISLVITPVANTNPLAEGTYQDTLRVRIEPQ